MTKPHDERFSEPAPISPAPADFLPELKPDDPEFIKKLAEKRGFKFTDNTAQMPDP